VTLHALNLKTLSGGYCTDPPGIWVQGANSGP
jgi:hypothetical protein